MGLFDEIIDAITGDDLVETIKHEGGKALAKRLVQKKRDVIIKAYDEARAAGDSEHEALLDACREFAERTL